MTEPTFQFRPGIGVRNLPIKRTPRDTDLIREKPEPEALALRLDDLAVVLEEMRNFGVRVLGWIAENERFSDERVGPLLLIRHALQQLDAMALLVTAGAIESAKIQLRALLEAMLYFEHMLGANDAEFVQRAQVFYTAYVVESLARDKKVWPGTAEHTEHDKRMKEAGFEFSPPPFPGLADSVKKREEVLSKEPYRAHVDELERAKGGRPYVNWYAAYGGPRSIYQIAKGLGHDLFYEIVYGYYSAAAHAADVYSNSYSTSDKADLAVHMLRNPEHAETLVYNAHAMIRRIYDLAVERLCEQRSVNYDRYLGMIAQPLYRMVFGADG